MAVQIKEDLLQTVWDENWNDTATVFENLNIHF